MFFFGMGACVCVCVYFLYSFNHRRLRNIAKAETVICSAKRQRNIKKTIAWSWDCSWF